jgi:selenoprotein W-related protein
LADEIQQTFEIPTRLIKGSRGAFEVKLDGELLFSKHESGRFPEPGEISEQLASRLKA